MARGNRSMAVKFAKAKQQKIEYVQEQLQRNAHFDENVAKNTVPTAEIVDHVHRLLERGEVHVHRYAPTEVPDSAKRIGATLKTRKACIVMRKYFNTRTQSERAMVTPPRRKIRDVLTGQDYDC